MYIIFLLPQKKVNQIAKNKSTRAVDFFIWMQALIVDLVKSCFVYVNYKGDPRLIWARIWEAFVLQCWFHLSCPQKPSKFSLIRVQELLFLKNNAVKSIGYQIKLMVVTEKKKQQLFFSHIRSTWNFSLYKNSYYDKTRGKEWYFLNCIINLALKFTLIGSIWDLTPSVYSQFVSNKLIKVLKIL